MGKNVKFAVQLLVHKLVDRGFDGTDVAPPGDGLVHGGEDSTRRVPCKNLCYWHDTLAGAFDGAGDYRQQQY